VRGLCAPPCGSRRRATLVKSRRIEMVLSDISDSAQVPKLGAELVYL
jgi:hypothetical protein